MKPGQKLLLKIASEGSDEQQLNRGAKYWFDMVVQQCDDIEIEYFNNGQLGNVKQTLEAMLLGEPLVIITDSTWLSDFAPDFDVIQGPYFGTSSADYLKVQYTPWFQEQCDILYKNGYKVLNGGFLYGIRHTIATKAIRSPTDFRGLKMRTPNNEMSINIMEAMGATATPLAYGEMYTALAQGVVNGVENPIATIYDAKLYESAKFLSMTGHQTTLSITVMGASTWEKLSSKTQQAIIELGRKAADHYNADIAGPADNAGLDAMIKQGVTVIQDVNVQAFKDATVGVYGKVTKWTTGLYNRIQREISQVKR
jgi:TRAP-type C4-dicarboxylate transport system substrate-binding protein